MDVGFVGLGAMGQVIVPRLLAAGHAVTGWNRSRERAAPLLAQGMHWADTPGGFAAASAILDRNDFVAAHQVYRRLGGQS